MKVSLDGGATFTDAPQGVRVRYPGRELAGEGEFGELLINCTDEGIVLEAWTSEDEDAVNISTSSETVDEIINRLSGKD